MSSAMVYSDELQAQPLWKASCFSCKLLSSGIHSWDQKILIPLYLLLEFYFSFLPSLCMLKPVDSRLLMDNQ